MPPCNRRKKSLIKKSLSIWRIEKTVSFLYQPFNLNHEKNLFHSHYNIIQIELHNLAEGLVLKFASLYVERVILNFINSPRYRASSSTEKNLWHLSRLMYQNQITPVGLYVVHISSCKRSKQIRKSARGFGSVFYLPVIMYAKLCKSTCLHIKCKGHLFKWLTLKFTFPFNLNRLDRNLPNLRQ